MAIHRVQIELDVNTNDGMSHEMIRRYTLREVCRWQDEASDQGEVDVFGIRGLQVITVADNGRVADDIGPTPNRPQ